MGRIDVLLEGEIWIDHNEVVLMCFMFPIGIDLHVVVSKELLIFMFTQRSVNLHSQRVSLDRRLSKASNCNPFIAI